MLKRYIEQVDKNQLPGIDYGLMDEHTKARVNKAIDEYWIQENVRQEFKQESDEMYERGLARKNEIKNDPTLFPDFKERYEKEAQRFISLIKEHLKEDSDAYRYYYGLAYLMAKSPQDLAALYKEFQESRKGDIPGKKGKGGSEGKPGPNPKPNPAPPKPNPAPEPKKKPKSERDLSENHDNGSMDTEGTGNLKDSSPIKIPSNAVKVEQAKNGYDQAKYTWSDGTYKYEARWHTRTPGAPADQGNTWVITRTTPGSQTTRKQEHILTNENQWTSMKQWQDAVRARQNGAATPEQQALLDSGHWPAP